MFKRLIVGALVVGLLTVGQMVSALARERITLRYWTEPMKFNQWLIKEFEARHPYVRIEHEEIPSGNMVQKVTVSVAAGETPDILEDYAGRLGSWANMGLLENLSGTLTREEAQDFVPGILDLFTARDKLFGYPFAYWVAVYIVNKTILDKVGVGSFLPPEEKPEWTLSTWMKIAEKVKSLPRTYATCFFAKGRGGDYWMLMNYQIFGASLYKGGDYTETALNSEEGVAALEWMIELVKKGYAPKGVAGIGASAYCAMMDSGEIAMAGNGPQRALPERQRANYEQGVCPYIAERRVVETPHVEGIASPPLFVGPSGYVIFKQVSPLKKKLAVEFLKFVIEPGNLARICRELKQFPPRKSVKLYQDVKVYQQVLDMIARVGVADMGIASPHYVEVRNLLCAEHQAAFMGVKTAKQALDDFAKSVRNLWQK